LADLLPGEARTAIITGAARGIGAACAQAFAGAGWNLILVDRDSAELAAADVAGAGGACALPGDVAHRTTNDAAVRLAHERFGRLDAVIASAGATLASAVDDTTDEDIDRLVDVNLRALIYLAQAVHSSLRQTSGSLVVMASKTGLVAQPNSPLYCATKGAAVLLARALALDWAPEGIRVNAVCPGIVDTPMLEDFLDQLPDPAAARSAFAIAQPLGRLAQPAECASAALFLASPAASFITGVALPDDGGYTAQ
jgi:2,3-dihydro-2,3-dihydroxybenzoate dehydrogenase